MPQPLMLQLSSPKDATTIPDASMALSELYRSAPRVPRKMILKQWKKETINIIIIGETGVGKTAMLNLLANVCAGFELEEFHHTHAFDNEQGGSGSGSQTNKPVLYNIKCADGRQVNILDTPGLADTRGIDMDNHHKESIANAINKDIEVIDAVIILANGTLARLGAATDYALTIIAGMFPNSIINNIGFVFTMVSDPTDFNFERSSLPKELQQAPLWSINNPFAQWFKYQEKRNQNPPPDIDILEDMDDSVRRGYRKSLRTLSNLFEWLDRCTVQPTSEIYKLYIMSTEIEASISNVIARMDQTEGMCSELVALQNDKSTQEQARKINEKYEEIINKPFFEHEDTGSQHNTLCIAGNCYSNCHIGCGVGFTMDRSTLGWQCVAFNGSGFAWSGGKRRCQQDGCGHLAEEHQHYRSKWVKKIKEDRQVDQAAKERYDEATNEADRIAALMEGVKMRISELEKDILDLEEELSELCERYNNLALSGSFIGYISSAIHLLKLREETMKKERASEEALSRMAQRIKLLENKKKVVEDAQKSRLRRVADEALARGRQAIRDVFSHH
uniref:AIG1-type G domain-containing protein n=1 Tax=Moniliophthora roreri TaxID=221103 RepID=A0A0W0FTY7_MONRR